MAKKVKVDVEVNDNGSTEEAASKFTRLQLQIRETQTALQQAQAAGDNVKFNQLKNQLDDLQDTLEINTLKSRKFDDALAAIPGPAGQVGGAIKGVDSAFKVLIANPAVAFIAAIGGALLLMKKALSSTAEGQETLNRLSQAFSKILGPILALVEKVAVPVFNGFAFILEKVGEGFNKFAKFLGISESKIKEATLSVDEVQQKANEAEKKRQEELTKKQEEQQKKREENAKKAEEKRKKDAEQRRKDIEEAGKVETDAYLATLDERDKELYQRGQKLNEDIVALNKAGVKDLSGVREAYRLDVLKINKKYDDQDTKEAKDKAEKEKKALEDKNKELLEKEKVALDLKKAQGLVSEEEYQAALLQIKTKYANADIEQQQALVDFYSFTKDKQKEFAEQIKESNKQMAESWIMLGDQFGRTFSDLAQLFDKGSAASKIFGVISVVINAASAIGKIKLSLAEQVADYNKAISTGTATIASGTALLSNPVTAAIGAAQLAAGKAAVAVATAGLARAKISAGLQIGSVAVTSAAQIAAILSAKKSASISGAAGSETGGSAVPAFGGQIQAAAPIIGRSSVAPEGTIAGIVTEAITRDRRTPIQTYVIGTQVSSQQELDRRVTLAARLGG